MTLTEQNSLKVDECLSIAYRYYNRKFAYETIRYDLRGKTAGQLVYDPEFRLPYLRFNVSLLEKYKEEFVEQVATHECAHLVAFEVYGRKIRPHGKEWKYVMKAVFGADPLVRHSYETDPVRKLNEYKYLCGCEDRMHHLTTIRHNKVIRGKARYRCKACAVELYPAEV